MRKVELKVKGYTVFIVECADGSYYSDLGVDLKRKLKEIAEGRGYYFSTHPERLPVKVVFQEDNVPFREAFADRKSVV